MTPPRFDQLTATLAEINAGPGPAPAAAALFDYQGGRAWTHDGDRWFHAASTIKIAVLACAYAVLEQDHVSPDDRLPVHNQFFSAADASLFAVPASRDSDLQIYSSIGETLPIRDLARRMITISSNLATNVLLEFVGAARGRQILADAGVAGVNLVRGVEDDRAFEAGISNQVTANGLVGLLRAIYEGRFGSEAHAAAMIDVLCGQTFARGIPAGLPPPIRKAARIAHKTGEISTATHDAGIVWLPGRPPYVLAVLTGAPASAGERYAPIARISARALTLLDGAGEHLEPGIV